MRPIRVLISIASAAALGLGCGAAPEASYRTVSLHEAHDPMAPERDHPVWHPPEQFAVWVQPHRDVDRRVLVGGHWMVVLLSDGSWYPEETGSEDPVPDGEASERDRERSRAALAAPESAALPYRLREEDPR